MKISNELLKRYSVGNCNPQEKRAVEAWINYLQDDGLLSEKEFGNSIDSIRTKLFKTLFHQKGETPIIRFYKNSMRFAAAACIIFAAFFGGRVSAKNTSSKTIEDRRFNEHLYFVGNGDLKGNLPGNNFQIEFGGVLQLYNASKKMQSVVVGDSTFRLHPGLYYYLEGSTQNPKLVDSKVYGNKVFLGTPSAKYVSIVRTDNL
ncbi:MAG: hypothetical protein AAF554_18300 [Bacteroidota bacterium]